MKYILLFTFGLFSVGALRAQQINLKPGDEFAMQTHSTETAIDKKKLLKDEAYTFQFKMLGINGNECKLQCTMLKAKQWGPEKMDQLNVDSIRQTIFNNSALLMPLILLQKPFTVIISPKGKLLRIEGADALAKQAVKNWHLGSETAKSQEQHIEYFIKETIKNMFLELPEQRIAFQSTWTNAESKVTYNVNTIRGALLDINTVTSDKTSLGNYTLNETNGLLENVSKAYNQTGVPNAKRYNYDQTLKYGKSTAPVADTAWVNMAILLSYWSNAFTNKANEPDSAKIMGYFNAHDALYADDQYYTGAKLDFYNKLDSREGYKLYQAMLKKTPNAMISPSSSHVFNKLQAVSNDDVDGTYDVLKMFSKDGNLYDWLQNSYGQHFLKDDHAVADKIMEKLLADKKLGMQAQLVPMSLWVDVKNHYKDNALMTAYSGFMKMNDDYMKKGNGGRYALLVYQMLKKDIKHKEAENLLDKTIQNLERLNADTLNKEKYAHRNMLAYAYYSKYRNAGTADSAKALQYLAKASFYSPGDKKEKAHISFYDRAFLNSKESYREEFINKLFAYGNTDEALKIFADQITADPQKIEEMKKIYQKQFPDKSFKEFFIDKVVSRWADAPAFELTDLAGKKHPLTSYKGQWLVMDFWGTWCGPCREEMPDVNKFNTEVAEGKFKGVNLLGVACYDTESKVRAYLKDNNYGMQVAISDNVIEKNYKIIGFPSKILVAPNGKMIDIQFGADWKSVIRNFNQLYAATN
ncbi:MAG: DUF6263 family protein [Bacteroidota bacterium]